MENITLSNKIPDCLHLAKCLVKCQGWKCGGSPQREAPRLKSMLLYGCVCVYVCVCEMSVCMYVCVCVCKISEFADKCSSLASSHTYIQSLITLPPSLHPLHLFSLPLPLLLLTLSPYSTVSPVSTFLPFPSTCSPFKLWNIQKNFWENCNFFSLHMKEKI